jgi:glycosyltransferase involved in cell wall biosynthesis
MRFVLVSTHVDQTTGYSKVSYNLLKQLGTLAPRVKTFHFGFQRHPGKANLRKVPDGVKSYDAAANEDPKEEGFGFNKIHEYLEMVNPDVVMIYNDPITIARFLENMKYEPGVTPYKVWVYLDQVYEGITPVLINAIRKNAERIYCFSEHWKKVFLTYGPAADVRIMEHAVDPSVFSKLPADVRKSTRANLNIPSDGIVLLNMNRNSERKRLDLTLQGFVRALARNPKLYLIVATGLDAQSGAYYDMPRILEEELKRVGLDMQTAMRNIIFINTSAANIIDDTGVNQLYNLADIGINTSNGEGYGLCQLEHLYTGAPQIVTDVGTYRSFLTDDVATYVPSNGRAYFAGGMPHGGWYSLFDADAVATAIESAVARLPEAKKAATEYGFKTWSMICDEFLEDVLTQASGQASSGSAPVTLALPSA